MHAASRTGFWLPAFRFPAVATPQIEKLLEINIVKNIVINIVINIVKNIVFLDAGRQT